MPSLLDNYPGPQDHPTSFAEPDETLSYGERLAKASAFINPIGAATKDIVANPGAFADLFGSAEKQTRLVDNAFASDQAREQAYDRRIKAVKDATGVELENPDRGGYRPTGHEMAALAREGPVDPWAVGRQRFEQQLAAVRDKNPEKSGDLQFGSIDDEAQAIAKGAEGDYDAARKATPLGTPASLMAEFGGAMWGQRRDPFFVGSLVAGPTSAVGRTVAARILTSGLFQGLYNAGLSLLEQPAVQAWRQQIGLRSGIQPAAEQVGMAFLSGMIPGAALRGVHEGLTAPLRRVLTGIPEAGDLDKALTAAKSALGEIDAGMAPAPIAKELPIIGFRRDAAEYERSLPPIEEGNVRLWRGNRPDEVGKNPVFTNDLPGIALPFRKAYGGPVSYVDVPAADLAKYENRSGAAPGAEFTLPRELASKAQVAERAPAEVPVTDRAIKLGEDMDAATRATAPARPKDIPPELHDDMTTAAQRHGEDPIGQPSPAAVAAVNHIEGAQTDLPKGVVEDGTAHRLPITGADGSEIGHIKFEIDSNDLIRGKKTVQVSGVQIDDAANRGKGYGVEAYQKLADFALSTGRELWSDRSVSPDAARIYEALERRGYTVIKEVADQPRHGALYKVTGAPKNDKPMSPAMQEVQQRVEQAKPQNQREAQMAATEALEDIGNRGSIAATTEALERDKLPAAPPPPQTKGTYYIGTEGEFSASRLVEMGGSSKEKAIFLADTTHAARDYGETITEVQLNAKNPKIINWRAREGIPERTRRLGLESWYDQDDMVREINRAREEGHDVLFIQNIEEQGSRAGAPHTQVAVLDPDIIRPGKSSTPLPAAAAASRQAEIERLQRIASGGRQSKDPLDKIPLARDDGTPTLVSAQQAARAGERETKLADLIRECK